MSPISLRELVVPAIIGLIPIAVAVVVIVRLARQRRS
jgi:hypothetical protein